MSPAPRAGAGNAWVLGVDSGGSGLRVALARPHSDTGRAPRPVAVTTCAEPVRTGPAGIDAEHMMGQLVPAVRALLAEADTEDGPGPAAGGARIAAACVGAAGMATLGDGLRAELPGALSGAFGIRRLALAADAVTAYAGALGERPGAVVAAGTGMIAMGTDLRSWRRADGWGHLLGDCGSGAWIGRAGLEAAMRDADGRTGGSAALRSRAEERFGAPLSGLPAQLYPRPDRPAVLASFAPEVARCAESGDPVAGSIVRAAAGEIAASAVAVCPRGRAPEGEPVTVAFTGGLFRLGEALTGPLRAELARLLPTARVTEAAGDPLDGALLIAGRLAADGLSLPSDATLLAVS
ncbi:ATPase [Streptomyces sp. NBC_01186]|nr:MULTISPECIES: BadF/BadG/BcrA/BcrD ATPase family protein [unclassified Streptomyces]WSB74548.1 ATPase [Streptomyces sp. NBC_01775]WSS17068.1 ATPase [Streptomyces sp. NBC_01186]WSS45811.1 ATPase [Streptomyces sp. NBC_01187]